MTGGAPPSSKKQEPQELAGAAIEPEDEEGLSAAEVCMSSHACCAMCCLHAFVNGASCD